VANLLSQNAPVFLVGDSEFGSIAILRRLEQWRWFFVLRQKGNIGLWVNEQTRWQRMEKFTARAGQSAWYPNSYLTQTEIHVFRA